MTLYEVTKKVAKINQTKVPDVEKLPETSQKPEKINKKLKMPLVLPAHHNKRAKPSVIRQFSSRNKKFFKKPYIIAASAVAVLLLVWIISAFRGENVPSQSADIADASSETVSETPVFSEIPAKPAEPSVKPAVKMPAEKPIDPVLDVKASLPAVSAGDHVIVLAHYRSRDQLLALQGYFRQNGFDTIIEKSGTQYVLITRDRFMNPNRPGNDGYAARQKLIEIGNKYVPEKGYLPFTFDDIYGKKIK